MPYIADQDFMSPSAAKKVSDVQVYEASMPTSAITSTSLQHSGKVTVFPNINSAYAAEHVSRAEHEDPVDCLVPSGETENDTGYLSHDSRDDSSEHSLYTQASQNLAMRPDQQMTENSTNDWLEVIAEDNVSVQSMDNVEDLLYHFDKFFRDRFDGELSRFKNAMYEMLSEQQLHVRQIIHSVEMTPAEENDVVFPDSVSPLLENEENVFQDEVIQREDSCKEKTKSHILLELTSLSCVVTALLNETKYRV